MGLRNYPSLYLSFEGSLWVKDECGTLGRAYTKAVIPVPAGGLSTLSYRDYPRVIDSNGVSAIDTKSYDFDVCPTYGFADLSMTYWSRLRSLTSSTILSIGYPYHPILAIPQEVYSLEPEWRRCHWEYADMGIEFGIFDPPSKLLPTFKGECWSNNGIYSRSYATGSNIYGPSCPFTNRSSINDSIS